MSIKQAFEVFMAKDFEEAVDLSTRAFLIGGGYAAELLADGSYRVLWRGELLNDDDYRVLWRGRPYDLHGLIISIPVLNDDEWNDDESLRFYERVEKNMRDIFNECWLDYQASPALNAN